ncbi:hypothetical protein BP5796_01623 [Coleophoma crateriformis]|uniref:Uncharacterized protein n=1 Tax=Coleophoma crateriformis TaxID=565419 RepID=A0A3D8T152_9HELO|nr:hypothetical protein BP5796_01623 [Coleophoma crateriformis]
MNPHRPNPLNSSWNTSEEDDNVSPLTSPVQIIASAVVSPLSPEVRTPQGPAIWIDPPQSSPANNTVPGRPDSGVDADENHLHEGLADEIIWRRQLGVETEMAEESAKGFDIPEPESLNESQPFEDLTPTQKKQNLLSAIQLTPRAQSSKDKQKELPENAVRELGATPDGITYDGVDFYQDGHVIRMTDIPQGAPLLSALTLAMQYGQYDKLVADYFALTGKTPFEFPAAGAKTTAPVDEPPQSASSVKTEDAEKVLPGVAATYNTLNDLKKAHLAGDGDWTEEQENLINDISTQMEALAAKKKKHQLEQSKNTYADSPTTPKGSAPTNKKLESAERDYVGLVLAKYKKPKSWDEDKEEKLNSAARKFERLNALRKERNATQTSLEPQPPGGHAEAARDGSLFSLGISYRKTAAPVSDSPKPSILQTIGIPSASGTSSKPDELSALQVNELNGIQEELSNLVYMYTNLEVQMKAACEGRQPSKTFIDKNENAREALRARRDELANRSNVILNSVSVKARFEWKNKKWQQMIDELYVKHDRLEDIKNQAARHDSKIAFTPELQEALDAVARGLDAAGEHQPTMEKEASPETCSQLPFVPTFDPIRSTAAALVSDPSSTKEDLKQQPLNILNKSEDTEAPDNHNRTTNVSGSTGGNNQNKGKGKDVGNRGNNQSSQGASGSNPQSNKGRGSDSPGSGDHKDKDGSQKSNQANPQSLFAPPPRRPSSKITRTVDPAHDVRSYRPDPPIEGYKDEDSDPKLIQASSQSLFAPQPKRPSADITATVDPAHFVRDNEPDPPSGGHGGNNGEADAQFLFAPLPRRPSSDITTTVDLALDVRDGQPAPPREGHKETSPKEFGPESSTEPGPKQPSPKPEVPKPSSSKKHDGVVPSDPDDGHHFVPTPKTLSADLSNNVPASDYLIPGQNPPQLEVSSRRRVKDIYSLRKQQLEAASQGEPDNLALQRELISPLSVLDVKPLSKAAKRLSKLFNDNIKGGNDKYLAPQKDWADLLNTLKKDQAASALAKGKYFDAEDRLAADASNEKLKEEVCAATEEKKAAISSLGKTEEKVECRADAARLRPEIIDTVFNSLVSSLGRLMNNSRWAEAWRIIQRMKQKAELEDDENRYSLMQGRISFWSGVTRWNCSTTSNNTLPAALEDFERAEACGIINDGSEEGKYLNTYTELCIAGTGPAEDKDVPVGPGTIV